MFDIDDFEEFIEDWGLVSEPVPILDVDVFVEPEQNVIDRFRYTEEEY